MQNWATSAKASRKSGTVFPCSSRLGIEDCSLFSTSPNVEAFAYLDRPSLMHLASGGQAYVPSGGTCSVCTHRQALFPRKKTSDSALIKKVRVLCYTLATPDSLHLGGTL